jgi:nucleotidyltransferase/DNA polymerase involved in DNA repair
VFVNAHFDKVLRAPARARSLHARRLTRPACLVRAQYQAEAERIRAILRDYDPHPRSMSLDEAYLDVTDFVAAARAAGQNMDGSMVAETIRRRVLETTQLTMSAGADGAGGAVC